MKYLHSGYILLCSKAEHTQDSKINISGLFDLFVVNQLPAKVPCQIVIGFGTPYERRQYKGHLELEDPNGATLLSHDFNANDPNNLFNGHSIFPVEIHISEEGCYTLRCSLYNWKNENVWEVSRQMWATLPLPEQQNS